MAYTSRHRRARDIGLLRPLAELIVGAVLGTAASLSAQPAAAATPWLTLTDLDGYGTYATFTVPGDYVGQVSQVVVDGNFGPSFNWAQLGLSRAGSNWSAVIGPLKPGLYTYEITADDTKVYKDPTNPTSIASEPKWSTFFIPGDSARQLADVPAGHGGTVETLTYRSTVADRERSALVWTPPGYDAHRSQPYPVLYLLDGSGQSYTDWVELGRAKQILDNLSIQGDMESMVVVMANGNVSNPEKELLNNILPAALRTYHISHDPAREALAGVSTGGRQALTINFAHPGEFAYVGSFASLLSDTGSPETVAIDGRAEASSQGTRLLRLYTGNVTDPAYNDTYILMKELDRSGVRYEFDGVNPAGGHNWNAWQANLADFVPRLFRTDADHGPSPGHLPLDCEFNLPPAGTTPTPWLYRDGNGDGFLSFETTTDFHDAQHVTVWANWAPGGSWLRMPLSPYGDRWRVTVGPLNPWFYYYRFFKDLVPVKDTSNPTSVTSEPAWSTFFIPGEADRLLADVPAGRGGAVSELNYFSNVAGADRTAYVWTPPGYDSHRAQPYPVLYLQHGGGQSYTDWVEMGRAKQILDNEFLDGKLVPMVVVMGNGNVSDFTSELLQDIVPAARATYHISDQSSQQALAGLSMGGGQTYAVLKSHPGEFAYIGTFSAGFGSTSGVEVEAINGGTKMLRVYTGDPTDFVYPTVLSTLSTFDQLGIRYQFAGVTQGPHGWDTWQKNLIDFAPRLFRDGQTQAETAPFR